MTVDSRAVLALGANLGDRESQLRTAVASFGTAVVAVSHGYETPPWGDTDQPPYLNAVMVVAAPAATPWDWLTRAQRAEQAAGRVRDPARRYGPRPLDVDVIAVWEDGEPVVVDLPAGAAGGEPALTVPHPRAHLRAFVLVPWSELEPDAELPGYGRIADLLAAPPVATDVPEVRRLDDVVLWNPATR